MFGAGTLVATGTAMVVTAGTSFLATGTATVVTAVFTAVYAPFKGNF